MNELLFFLLFFLLNFVSLLQCSHNYCMQSSDFVSLQGKKITHHDPTGRNTQTTKGTGAAQL